MRRQELDYSLDKSQNYHSIVRKLFNSPYSVAESLSNKTSSIRPVFIVGMPRSGTSLVEQIIASHNAVYGAGELNTLTKLITQNLKDHYTQDTNSLPEKAFLSIRKQYLDTLSHFNVPENVITDKWPLNFRNIGFILSAFPEAKIVHLKRDARATCWSNYQCFFTNKENGTRSGCAARVLASRPGSTASSQAISKTPPTSAAPSACSTTPNKASTDSVISGSGNSPPNKQRLSISSFR